MNIFMAAESIVLYLDCHEDKKTVNSKFNRCVEEINKMCKNEDVAIYHKCFAEYIKSCHHPLNLKQTRSSSGV